MRAFVFLAALLLSLPAAASGPLTLGGPAHTGQFRFEGRSIPLPPGTWRELERHVDTPAVRGGPGAVRRQIALLREAEGGADAVLLVMTWDVMQAWESTVWSAPGTCTRDNGYHRQVAELGDAAQDCLLVLHSVARAGSNDVQAWHDWVRLGQQHPGALPATLVGAQYRFASGGRGITLSYNFGVEGAGFPRQDTSWRESPWHPTRLDDARRAYVQRITAWATGNADAVRAGVMRQREATLPNP